MTDTAYSPGVADALRTAAAIALREKHGTFGVPHLMTALLTENNGLKEILASMQQDVGYLTEWFDTHREVYRPESEPDGAPKPDRELLRVLDEAGRSRIKLGTDSIDAVCILAALLREGVVYSRQQIASLGLTEADILDHYDAREPMHAYQGEELQITASVPYAENLKTEAVIAAGAQVVGREQEVRTMLECLERAENKGILLTGESGTGKSAVIDAFVRALCLNADELLQQTAVVGLQAARLLASAASESEVAQKTAALLHKLNRLERAVLVIDDLQMLLENGATGKASILVNVLSAQISDGAAKVVLAATNDAYRKHLEKHPIAGRLDRLKIENLEQATLEQAVRLHKQRLERHYELTIAEECVRDSIALSRRYFKERSLPAAAIQLLDRTAAAVRLCNKNAPHCLEELEAEFRRLADGPEAPGGAELYLLYRSVFNRIGVVLTTKLTGSRDWDPEQSTAAKQALIGGILQELHGLAATPLATIRTPELEAIVAAGTDIPIGKIQAREKDKLLHIEQRLQERVKGQERAIRTLSDAIIESRSGLSDPRKPIGSFFFLGPTGTGKTELTKALAELLFDDESAMIRFDMSEFKEEHSAALLYGAPPGYVGYEEGGLLVTQIRQKPYSVVLFDEIEKAHSSVYDVFLQLMDEGRIHDKLGREGDFSNAIIIFTSNIGSQWIAEQIRAGRTPDSAQLTEVMAQYFRPEFLGRLTEVVPFAPIDEAIARQIFLLHFGRLQEQLLRQKNIRLELSEEALQRLAAKGYSPQYGARPIAGVIRTCIRKQVSRLLVSEQLKPGDRMTVDYRNDQLIWNRG